MGLDMYLEAEYYVSEYFEGGPEVIKDLEKLDLNARLGGKKIKKLAVEVGYWRKANQIHKWFVDNCQGGVDECQRSFVSKDKLKKLLDTVNQVLENPELGDELLPTGGGFFFGSTEYDEYYIHDLNQTKKIIEDIFNTPEFDNWEFYYQSSW